VRRLDSRLAVGAIELLQPGVPEAPDRVYGLSARYTKFNGAIPAPPSGSPAPTALTLTDPGLPFRHDHGLQIPRLMYSPGLAPTTHLNALLNAASDS